MPSLVAAHAAAPPTKCQQRENLHELQEIMTCLHLHHVFAMQDQTLKGVRMDLERPEPVHIEPMHTEREVLLL